MADYESVPLRIDGGMHTSGDAAKAPEGSSIKIKNLVFAPGRLDKRGGWLREGTLGFTPDRLVMHVDDDDGSQTLVAGGAFGGLGYSSAGYRTSVPAWSTSSTARDAKDATNIFGYLYGLASGDDSTAGYNWSYDGATTFASNPFQTKVHGDTIDSYIRRLFIGTPRFPLNHCEFSDHAFNTATWTKAGGPPTVALSGTINTVTIANATTDSLKTAAAAYTTGAGGEEYVTWTQSFRARHATRTVPMTLTIENSTGATVYATQEYTLPSKSSLQEWDTISFTALVPASTDVYLKINMANTSGQPTVGDTFDISDSANNHGAFLVKGHFTYPNNAFLVDAISSTGYPNRVYWCETDKVYDWRNENYVDLQEGSGPITTVRKLGQRLLVMKRDRIWTFRPSTSAARPIIQEAAFENVGCVTVRAFETYNDIAFFVGENEVWMFDGENPPTPLCGDGRREEMFASVVSTPSVAIDTDNKRLYVYIRAGKIDVLDLNSLGGTPRWSYVTLTGSSDAELTIYDMLYCKPDGESNRELWVSMAQSADIVKLRASQTVDNITGTERDVVAEYVFKPVQSPDRKKITIAYLDIDHNATASQTGSTTTASFSYDGGSTFPKTFACTLGPVRSGGAADTEPMRVPIWQTDDRLLVKVTHSGKCGASVFNITGASVLLRARGKRTQNTNPSNGSASL